MLSRPSKCEQTDTAHNRWLNSLDPQHKTFIQQIKNRPGYAYNLAGYANALHAKRKNKALDLLTRDIAREALALSVFEGSFEKTFKRIGWYVSDQIMGWHYPMVHDHERNKLIDQALRQVIIPGESIVYEIGTGSGLITMMAARAGAKHVYSCELYPLVAKAARENIQKNGYEQQITVIEKSCFDIELDKDLPEPADVFIAEIVDSGLLSYGVLSMINDCWQKGIVTTDTKMLPCHIAAHGALVGGEEWCKDFRMYDVEGFDLSAFNVYGNTSGSFQPINQDLSHVSSNVACLLEFDLMNHPLALSGAQEVTFVMTKSGPVEAVLLWLELIFTDTLTFSNAPGRKQPSWRNPMLYFFDQPVICSKGDKVNIEVSYEDKSLAISFKGKQSSS